jgi:hypothetical protein
VHEVIGSGYGAAAGGSIGRAASREIGA